MVELQGAFMGEEKLWGKRYLSRNRHLVMECQVYWYTMGDEVPSVLVHLVVTCWVYCYWK